MEVRRAIVWVSASAVLMCLAACATTRNPLADSADTLNHNAQAFAQQSDAMTPALRQDAHQLADSTLEFRSVVGVNGTDSASAKTAFEDVSRSYHRVKADVDQVGTPNSEADLRPVTEAYQNVERVMRAPS
jgi:hypothetical protein